MANSKFDTSESKKDIRGGIVAGILLIFIGAGLFLFQWIDLPGLFPILLGGGFLIAGCVTHKTGLIIPGGIISGVGLAALAMQYNLFAPFASAESGGLFLVIFSLGWFLIPVLTRLFTTDPQWWALIPATILALIGGLILAGEQGLQILRLIGDYWPLALVIAGVVILFKYFKQNE